MIISATPSPSTATWSWSGRRITPARAGYPPPARRISLAGNTSCTCRSLSGNSAPARKSKPRPERRGRCSSTRSSSGICYNCPVAIDIGLVSRLVDTYPPALRAAYDALPAKTSACTRCGACVKRCPFAVNVLPIIDRAVALYE